MPDPEVSILTAVRDGRPHLEAAIASIRAQTLTRWEWILIDDGSRDGTTGLLERWAREDSRLRVVTTPPQGIVAALNHGLSLCRAPLVARMDADDVSHPDRLGAQAAYLRAHPSIVAADSRVQLLGGRRNAGMRAYVDWANDHSTPESIAGDLFVESPLIHPAVCYRADIVRDLGGYRAGDFPEDYDLWLGLHAAGHPLGKVPEVLLSWRDSPRRLTRSDPRYRRAAFTALKQRHLETLDGDLMRGPGFVLAGAAPFARPWRQWLRRIGARPEFIAEIEPRRIGERILDAPVVPLEELRRRPWRALLVTVSGQSSRAAFRSLLARWNLGPRSDRHVRYV